MNEPVRIVSDLHLGHRVSRVESVAALRPLIAGAGTMIFNGDTWQELTLSCRERSAEMLAQLRALCADEGCEPLFLAGNHDPGWPGPGWAELANGRIIITHGDGLLFEGSPWKREIITGRDEVRALWRDHPGASTDVETRLRLARAIARSLNTPETPKGRKLWQRAWDALCPPSRALKMLDSWMIQGWAGARFCEHYFPQASVLVVGHFHRAGAWQHQGRLIINTGSFVSPARAQWVEWNHGWLTHGQITESPNTCHIGPTLGTWRL